MSTVTTNRVATESPRAARPAPAYGAERPSSAGVGRVLFAVVMFVVAAGLNIIPGIAAVSSSHFFVASAHYILSGLNTWGWIAIVFGAVELLAAVSIWSGGAFGRWFGVLVAGVSAVLAMMIPAYPFWSLTLVAIAFLVIYGLVAYGGKPELTR